MKLFLLAPVAAIALASCTSTTTNTEPPTTPAATSTTPSAAPTYSTPETPNVTPNKTLPTDDTMAKLIDTWNTEYTHQKQNDMCIKYKTNPTGVWETFKASPKFSKVTIKEFVLFFDTVCIYSGDLNNPNELPN